MVGTSLCPFFDVETTRAIRNKARQLCCCRPFTGSDREDVEQDLTVHLHRWQHRYDPKRASWMTFIACVLDRAAASMMRKRCSKRRGGKRSPVSLDHRLALAAELDDRQGGSDLVYCPMPHHDLAHDLATERSSLPDELKFVFDGLGVHSISALARANRTTNRSITKKVRLLRRICECGELKQYRPQPRAQRPADPA